MGELVFEIEKDKFAELIQGKVDQMNDKVNNLVDDIADKTLSVMMDEAPFNSFHGGELRDKINIKTTGEFERFVTSDAPYLPFVVYPTAPHIIEAKNAQALGPFSFGSYLGVSGGGYVQPTKTNFGRSPNSMQYFKSVHHPGTSGNDFIERTKNIVDDSKTVYVNEFLGWLTNTD